MKLDNGILDHEESFDPAEEEPSMLGWGGNNIFGQDVQPYLLIPLYTGCHSF